MIGKSCFFRGYSANILKAIIRMKKIIVFLLLFNSVVFVQAQKPMAINTEAIKVDSLLWDLKTLSIAPDFKWLTNDGPVRSLLYKSVDYEGKPTEVFAYYSNPDIIAGKQPGKQKFPGLVLIHGGGGKAFKEWVEKWAKEGYAAIAMDLSGNGENGQKIANPGPDQSNENKFGKIEKGNLKDVWTYHAVASSILAHSLLQSFPEIDQAKTGVTGISWGGYLTCIVGSLDNRFKASSPVYGCAFYNESDVFSVPLTALSEENKQRWMRYFDPSNYMRFAKNDFFFINGNKDKHYNVAPYIKTYNLLRANKKVCIIPEMKHSHEWGWQPPEIRFFFETIFNPGQQFVRVDVIFQKGNDLVLNYTPNKTDSLSLAEFYYTNDTTSTNEERIWKRVETKTDPKRHSVSCPMPSEGFKYGFFYLKDGNGISSSSGYLVDLKPDH
jgi:cephalosporin-C deacetylase-like acetyl esterase